MITNEQWDNFLKQIEDFPNISFAAQTTGIGRSTIHRKISEDKDFGRRYKEALICGRKFLIDLAESKLIEKIKEGNFSAIRYYLSRNEGRYHEKSIPTDSDPITKVTLEIVDFSKERDENNPKPDTKKESNHQEN